MIEVRRRACADFHEKVEAVLFAKSFAECQAELFHFESCRGCHAKFQHVRDFFAWCEGQRQGQKSRFGPELDQYCLSTKLAGAVDSLETDRLARLLEALDAPKNPLC